MLTVWENENNDDDDVIHAQIEVDTQQTLLEQAIFRYFVS